MTEKLKVMEAFDAISHDYARLRWRSFPEVSKLLDKERFGLSCDLGSGPGTNLPLISERSRAVVCLDFSPRMLTLARNRAISEGCWFKVDLIAADLEHLPFKENAFDLSMSIAVLHHLSEFDRISTFSEIIGITKPLGKAIASVWAPGAILRSKIASREGDLVYVVWKVGKQAIHRPYYLCDLEQWKRICDSNEFRYRDIFVSGTNFFASGMKF